MKEKNKVNVNISSLICFEIMAYSIWFIRFVYISVKVFIGTLLFLSVTDRWPEDFLMYVNIYKKIISK